MIVRAALAALACLAARVAGQAKQCDPLIPDIKFNDVRIDDAVSNGRAVLAADLNGDGDIDIAAAIQGDDKFKWYKNDLFTGPNGNISFSAHDVVTTSAITSPNGVHAADIDGDGDADLLLSYGTSDSNSFLQWYENDKAAGGVPYDDGANLHVISIGDPFSATSYMMKPVMAHGIDVDGDGDIDVTAVAFSSSRVTVFTNDLETTSSVPFPADPASTTFQKINNVVTEPVSVFPADVDGDSDVDVLVASETATSRITFYRNDGSQDFDELAVTVSTSLTDVKYVFATKFGGGDDHLELLAASNTDGFVALYENDGGAEWYKPTSDGGTGVEVLLTQPETDNNGALTNYNARGASSVRAADFNGDGANDVLFAGASLAAGFKKQKLVWLENLDTGQREFKKNQLGDLGTSASPEYYVDALDVDNDGDVDAVIISYENTWLDYYQNDCAAEPTPAPTADVPTSVPTGIPTSDPSAVPTTPPSPVPTVPPTAVPTGAPTSEPTGRPTVPPTALPTGVPTTLPSSVPTVPPTPIPAPIPTPAPTPRPSVRCSAGVAFSTEHNVEASGRYLNVHVVDGAKIKVARRLHARLLDGAAPVDLHAGRRHRQGRPHGPARG